MGATLWGSIGQEIADEEGAEVSIDEEIVRRRSKDKS